MCINVDTVGLIVFKISVYIPPHSILSLLIHSNHNVVVNYPVVAVQSYATVTSLHTQSTAAITNDLLN